MTNSAPASWRSVTHQSPRITAAPCALSLGLPVTQRDAVDRRSRCPPSAGDYAADWLSGFADAYKAVAGVFHSHGLNVAFGILIVLTLLGSGAVWLEGADRNQAIAALDGAAPAWMGRFASFGTPITVNLMSGIIGSAFVFFVFLITKGSLANFFSVMIALVISTTAVSYFFIFPALVVLRMKHPNVNRPYRVPGGMAGAWVAAIITEAFVVITAITLLWPGGSTPGSASPTR